MARRRTQTPERAASSFLPLTVSGAVLLVLSVGLLLWAYRIGHDHVVRVVAWSGICLPVASVLLVWIEGSRQRRRIARLLTILRPCCGEMLPDAGPLLDIRYRIPVADEARRVLRRGLFPQVQYRLLDPLKLASVVYTLKDADMVVSPAITAPVDPWPHPAEVATGEEWSARGKPQGDMLEIGEYRHGDPLRFVLWKISARRGGRTLYVRRPETVGDSKLAYFFVAGPGDDATAELVQHLVREGRICSDDLIVFNTDEDGQLHAFGEDPLVRLAASGSLPISDPLSGFARFRDLATSRRVSAWVVFIPGDRPEEVRRRIGETDFPTHFVCGTRIEEIVVQGDGTTQDIRMVRMESPKPR